MLAFSHGLIKFHRSSFGTFCKQCYLTRAKVGLVPCLQQKRIGKVFGNSTYFLCSFSETSFDEIDETIKEAQGSELSRVDSELLKHSLTGNILGVQQALAAGAKPGVKDKEGRTALHLASAIGVPSICEILLKAAGELAEDCLNSKDHLGLTPLHMAAGYCRISTVECLLSWKPDVNIRNQDGYRPVDLVAKLLEREPKRTFFFVTNERYSTLQEIYNMLKPFSQ
ncbi:hypothetical protein GpartN1_g480.t1 [Galdieria partita]|uniref:Uncharacterized protein n=1 Tax=Galdieria partita TaxID=83374 RepID=A0A9C7PR52_9RHOD|nr:hypothetical protein GpartN1_g480.t1 [Galdieria partita]